jgi:phage terminase large subunit
LNYKSEQQLSSQIPAPLLEQINNGAHGGLIPYTFKQLGVKKDKEIICDNNKPLLIELLQVNGWGLAVKATKGIGSKIEGVSLVQSTNVVFTKESKNFDFEQKNYQYKKESKGNFIDEPLSVNNHLMDCLKYVRTFIFEEGIG